MDELARQVPELRYIDEDTSQLTIESDNYPLAFPAVLIGLEQTDWTNTKQFSQRGRANIRVTLCVDCYDDTHYGQSQQDRISDRLSLWKKVDEVLHCMVNGGSPMMRTQTQTATTDSGIKMYSSVYSLSLEENLEGNAPEDTPPDPLVEDPNITHRQILDKMSREMPQLREALSAFFCPRFQHLSNESIRTSDNPMIMDLSGHNRHLVMINFEGTPDSGVDADGNVHFNGINNYAYYMPLAALDTNGMGDMSTRGYCIFADRTFDVDPYNGTTITYAFGGARWTAPASAPNIGLKTYAGTNNARSNTANGYYYLYGTTQNSGAPQTAYDGVSFLNVRPNPEFNATDSVPIEWNADGRVTSTPVKGSPTFVVKGFLFGGLYYASNVLAQPFRGTFRAVAWFNRCLTDDEIEWVKNNMKFSRQHTISPMSMMSLDITNGAQGDV